mmetsp:Transcript_34079/g.67157  ORF Transcript_34079/g.67157 Transcript_34079/m.67157 type:complete len:1151 (-) Transcript_34079:441-3893(-)
MKVCELLVCWGLHATFGFVLQTLSFQIGSSTVEFRVRQAEFGGAGPDHHVNAPVLYAKACNTSNGGSGFVGAIMLVKSGGDCSIVETALMAQHLRAAALLIMNEESTQFADFVLPGCTCNDNCHWSNNSFCNDGGIGSTHSYYGSALSCPRGTDCTDCGVAGRGTGNSRNICQDGVPTIPTFGLSFQDGKKIISALDLSLPVTGSLEQKIPLAATEKEFLKSIAKDLVRNAAVALLAAPDDAGLGHAVEAWSNFSSSNPFDPCLLRLPGTSCRFGHLVALSLSFWPQPALTTTIQEICTSFPALEYLDLIGTQFENGTGSIVGLNMSNFVHLALNDLGISGEMPSLDSALNLRYFSAQRNKITGQVPNLAPLRSIQFLEVGQNEFEDSPVLGFEKLATLKIADFFQGGFSGPLPDYSNLSQLEFLDLGENSFTGQLYPFDKMKTIKLLGFYWNENLHGLIPPLDMLSTLRIFDVEYCAFSGRFPPTAELKQLAFVYVSGNHFTGPLPKFGPNLVFFTGQSNQFSGSLLEIGSLTKLKELDIRNNRLSGPFPDLSRLTRLLVLDLNNNRLSGSASALSALTGAVAISLNQNYFSGQFPDLSSLSNLTTFSISHNHLTGNLHQNRMPSSLLRLNVAGNQLFEGVKSLSINFPHLNNLNISSNRLDNVELESVIMANPAIIDLSGNSFLCKYPRMTAVTPDRPLCELDQSVTIVFWAVFGSLLLLTVIVKLCSKRFASPTARSLSHVAKRASNAASQFVERATSSSETKSSLLLYSGFAAYVVFLWVDMIGDVTVNFNIMDNVWGRDEENQCKSVNKPFLFHSSLLFHDSRCRHTSTLALTIECLHNVAFLPKFQIESNLKEFRTLCNKFESVNCKVNTAPSLTSSGFPDLRCEMGGSSDDWIAYASATCLTVLLTKELFKLCLLLVFMCQPESNTFAKRHLYLGIGSLFAPFLLCSGRLKDLLKHELLESSHVDLRNTFIVEGMFEILPQLALNVTYQILVTGRGLSKRTMLFINLNVFAGLMVTAVIYSKWQDSKMYERLRKSIRSSMRNIFRRSGIATRSRAGIPPGRERAEPRQLGFSEFFVGRELGKTTSAKVASKAVGAIPQTVQHATPDDQQGDETEGLLGADEVEFPGNEIQVGISYPFVFRRSN